MNFATNDSVQRMRICAGKKCQRQGTRYLEVKYLNKYGWFCDSCMERLLVDGLIGDLSDGIEVRTQ
jgi:hypothetical protein